MSYTCTYDASGRRSQAILYDNSTWTDGYDSCGEVTSGTRKFSDGSNAFGAQFGYGFDVIGNRLSTTANGHGATYSPNSLNQYTSRTVPGYVDVSGEVTPFDGLNVTVNGSTPIRQNGYAYFGQELAVNNGYDGNGNVTGLHDMADGSLAARYEYGPFGEPLRASGSMAKVNPIQFSTRYLDQETGFYYYGYRYYTPSAGRWISREPLGDIAFVDDQSVGKSLGQVSYLWKTSLLPAYNSVHNRPTSKVDLLGLEEAGWHFELKPSVWYAVKETPVINVYYKEDIKQRACCPVFHIKRYVTKKGFKNAADDGTGDPSSDGIAYSEPDSPGWFHSYVNVPFTATFTWEAICVKGILKDPLLSRITRETLI